MRLQTRDPLYTLRPHLPDCLVTGGVFFCIPPVLAAGAWGELDGFLRCKEVRRGGGGFAPKRNFSLS